MFLSGMLVDVSVLVSRKPLEEDSFSQAASPVLIPAPARNPFANPGVAGRRMGVANPVGRAGVSGRVHRGVSRSSYPLRVRGG